MEVSGAYRDPEELLGSYGRVKMSAGHDDVLTTVLSVGVEKERA